MKPGVTRGHTSRKCYDWYACKDPSHSKCDLGYHVLVCDKHKSNNNNLKVLESHNTNVIEKWGGKLQRFSKEIKRSYYSKANSAKPGTSKS